MLLRRGVPLEAKPFQLGVRIEQPQEQIERGTLRSAAPVTPRSGLPTTHLVARAGDATCSPSACAPAAT